MKYNVCLNKCSGVVWSTLTSTSYCLSKVWNKSKFKIPSWKRQIFWLFSPLPGFYLLPVTSVWKLEHLQFRKLYRPKREILLLMKIKDFRQNLALKIWKITHPFHLPLRAFGRILTHEVLWSFLMGRWNSSCSIVDIHIYVSFSSELLFLVGMWVCVAIYQYCNIWDKEPAGQPLLSRQTYSNLWFVVVFRLTPIINTIMLFNTNVGGEIELLNQEKSSCLTFWSWDLCFGLSSTFSLILSYW